MRLYTTCAACGAQLAITSTRQATCATCPPRRGAVDVLEGSFLAAVMAGQNTEADRLAGLLDAYDRRPPAFLAAALAYAGWGWPVFPVTPGRKTPLIARRDGGHGLHDATTEAGQIRSWWTRSPTANIGLATGARFDVIDIDPPGLARWAALREALELSVHAMVSTPRSGLHLYLPPAGAGNLAGGLRLPGWDYRGRGGYVLAPPSVVDRAALAAPLPTLPRERLLRYLWLSLPSPALADPPGPAGGGSP